MMETVIWYSALGSGILLSILQQQGRNRIRAFPQATTKAQELYLKLLPMVLSVLAIYLILSVQLENDPFRIWKQLTLLSLLWMIAFVDYREQLILNEYLLMGLGLRGILLMLEMLYQANDAIFRLCSELLGLMILLALGLLLRAMSGKGIGMGDVKLFGVLPLFLGNLDALRVMLYALFIVFVQACFCLLTKRKGRKDVLPFAPAVLGGTLVLVIFSGR